MTLQEALLSVKGVINAMITIGESGPVGVQLEVAEGADRAALFDDVEQVLRDEGFRAALVDTAPEIGVVITPDPSVRRTSVGESDEGQPSATAARLSVATVAVSENDRGVEVAVRMSDGGRAARRCAADPAAVWQALGETLYELAGEPGPRPFVQAVEWLNVGGVDTVVVVVAVGDHRRLGAAAASATQTWAVAKAIWTALV